LITVAAMLPSSWDLRLIDRNVEELTPAHIDWADLVITTGMLPQQPDTREVIKLSRERGKPVAVGGPDVTSSPEIYAEADIRVLGEAELVIDDFIAAWNAGQRQGVFEAEKFKADVTRTPIPRFDLLNFKNYLFIGVQYSRGCPFTCEFCDIIELYGRVPRTKTNVQILAEIETLYKLGYRGAPRFRRRQFRRQQEGDKAVPPSIDHMAARPRLSLRVLDRSLDQSRRRRPIAPNDAKREFRHDLCWHREPGHRHAGRDAKEAEHPAELSGERAQDLRRRHSRNCGLHSRLR
jgi:radical SAM superfamily enzyme YgiQ (UPF0313 family)